MKCGDRCSRCGLRRRFVMKTKEEVHDCWESDYARDFVAWIHDRPACLTCKDPRTPIYSKKRCRHCYQLDLNVRNLEKKVERFAKEDRRSLINYEFELQLALAKINDAEREARKYGNISSKNLAGIDLEHEFAFLSERLLGENLFHGDASIFDHCLTQGQKQFVFYMLSQISRAVRKRNRRQTANVDVIRQYYADIE